MSQPTNSANTPLIVPELVRLDAPAGADKQAVINYLADVVAAAGRADTNEGLAADALAREATAPTGIPGGIAIPHCRSPHVLAPSLGFARLTEPVDFGAADGQGADLVFMIAAPAGADDFHLQLLAKLARGLMKSEFTDALRAAATPEDVARLVTEQVQPELLDGGAAASAGAPAAGESAAPADTGRVIVGVSSCPTGIAHTFMAAEALEQAGKERGVTVRIEGQGSGKIDWLDAELIQAADAVIFAHDLPVKGLERFAGKPVIDVGVKAAVNDAGSLVDQALAAIDDPGAKRVTAAAGGESESEEEHVHWARRLQRSVMTGVSYMIPFVAAGGLLTALGFLFGGYDITNNAANIVTDSSLWNLPDLANPDLAAPNALGGSPLMAYIGAVFFMLGSTAMNFLVPALAGYTAFGLAGRPGIAPGFAMGALSVAIGAGFIGGLIGGLLAGYMAAWLAGLDVPRWLRSLMPVVIIPLCTTLVVGSLMYMVLGNPLAALMNWLSNSLTSMAGSGSAVLLGVILGLMMCFDLGGPVNKAAYLFATAGLSAATAASYEIMAAVMAAGMVPPLALALATTVRPGLFTDVERDNGRAAWLLGASFISEGAIPFAAADPLRIIPPSMLGGAVTGALSMALHVGSRAPHGGIFVFFAIDNLLGFFISIIAGTVVTAIGVLILKQARARKLVAEAAAA
ncbi:MULTISPECIES: fructose-specific PTS transporter subunit EIIC [unclassified Actinomyces]|uniref:PTS fructose transporter subunit IIABC n=1 Tax=unclassified Actinomyces TaxID=2609248 RepID=UPI001373B329|nr:MULTISPECIES: fructose-specific PTS transporter subunit EIIC [unclassified Actinomyces]NDR53093.1 PTS transporter subunit EIIA [Actinomyces sp. 565]QHO90246.1 PTS lactose transporter subunit IIC [Actinomyces sp. 432]